jgi:hypothetical protein
MLLVELNIMIHGTAAGRTTHLVTCIAQLVITQVTHAAPFLSSLFTTVTFTSNRIPQSDPTFFLCCLLSGILLK